MHSNNFGLNDDVDLKLYIDGQLTLIEMQIDGEIEPFKDNTTIFDDFGTVTRRNFWKRNPITIHYTFSISVSGIGSQRKRIE